MPIKFMSQGKLTLAPAAPGEPAKPAQAPLPAGIPTITDFAQNYLKYHLHKAMASDTKPRHHAKVHMSDLDPGRQWCPREPALMDLHGTKRPPGFISTAQSTVFKYGHATADIVIGSLPPEIVWGTWKCGVCKHEHPHQYTPACCYECKAPRANLRYREVLMRDPATGLVGSADLFVDLLGNGTKTLIEIKSEGNDSFKSRTKPEFEHEWRTRGYLWLASRTPWLETKGINLKDARVLYVSKEGHAEDDQVKRWGLKDWAKSPFKEYHVKRDDTQLENRLDALREYVDWKSAHTAGASVPLPGRVCSSKSCARAGQCAVAEVCFA